MHGAVFSRLHPALGRKIDIASPRDSQDACLIPASARVLHRRCKHSSPDNRDCSHLTVSTQPGLAATLSSFIDFVVKPPLESDVCLQGIVAKSRKPATVSFASLTVGACLLHALVLPSKDIGARTRYYPAPFTEAIDLRGIETSCRGTVVVASRVTHSSRFSTSDCVETRRKVIACEI